MSQDNLTKKTLAGFKWSSLSALLFTGLRFIVLSVLAHLLLPHDFGVVGIALIFTSLAERVGQVGVGPALVQITTLNDTHIRIAAGLSFLVGVLMYAALYFSTPFIATFFSEPVLLTVLPIIAFVFIFEALSVVPQSLLERDLLFKALLFVDIGSYFLGYIVFGIVLAWLNYGVWSLVIAMLIARLSKMITLFFIVPPRCSLNFAVPETKQLLQLGAGFSLGRLLSYAALQGDNFVVGKMLGTDMLGMYTRAYQLMTLPATCFGQVLTKVLFPAMAKRQSDNATLSKVYLTSVETIAILSMPVSVGMALAAEEIVLVLFGNKWLAIIPALKILSFGIFFRTAYKSSDTLIRSLGAVYQHAARQAIYVFCIVVGAWIGAHWGLAGTAVAVFFAVGINYVLMSRLALQHLQLANKTFLLAHLPGLWLTLVTACILPLLLHIGRSAEYIPLVRLLLAAIPLAVVLGLATIWAPKFARPHLSLKIVKQLTVKYPKLQKILS